MTEQGESAERKLEKRARTFSLARLIGPHSSNFTQKVIRTLYFLFFGPCTTPHHFLAAANSTHIARRAYQSITNRLSASDCSYPHQRDSSSVETDGVSVKDVVAALAQTSIPNMDRGDFRHIDVSRMDLPSKTETMKQHSGGLTWIAALPQNVSSLFTPEGFDEFTSSMFAQLGLKTRCPARNPI